jgi:hypothetical protein
MENRAQSLYWNELTELRAAYEYARLYRDHLSRVDTWVSVARSVTGLVALGAWITTNINPHIWAGVIVFVQTVEVVQKATPFAAHLNGTNELCSAFESLFIGALQEWEQDISSGRVDEMKIKKSWGRLMTSRADADKKALPRGLRPKPKFEKLAKAQANAYFQSLYPEEPDHGREDDDAPHR